MTDLADFLLARIAEDEAAVSERTKHLAPAGWSYLEQFGDFGKDERWMIEVPAARVIAECEAKRRIVAMAPKPPSDAIYDQSPELDAYMSGAYDQWMETLRLLALPYADHPAYDEAWRP